MLIEREFRQNREPCPSTAYRKPWANTEVSIIVSSWPDWFRQHQVPEALSTLMTLGTCHDRLARAEGSADVPIFVGVKLPMLLGSSTTARMGPRRPAVGVARVTNLAEA